ncbi:hypothetical protein OMP38_24555 [Cohnella ginsengisoli]|uniref:Uncharacterized protein n=1 Tax=Cohnella ginsengisoli TaxID=425004 RepID=A0A9X4KKN9_9BACL|nr:hypothetical protein [Cohnella ginsengisoli]MDG0793646.1 hypothetical protein [Cohnella ginsengisoli]
MLWIVVISAMLLFSVIAAFSDKEGKTLGSLAQTATVFCLIYALFYERGHAVLCVLASVSWTVFQFSKSDTRWR